MPHTSKPDLISEKYDIYSVMVYKLCFAMLGNKSDAEDAVQETFLRYIKKPRVFDSLAHERAWFIRVAVNLCRDRQRFRLRHRTVSIHDMELYADGPGSAGTLESILALPESCKAPLYMHYVEGYSILEIAEILRCGQSAVKARMLRGRRKLKLDIEERRISYQRGNIRSRI